MLVGIVPRVCPVDSTQSSKSVYPLAIANCKENRYMYMYAIYSYHISIFSLVMLVPFQITNITQFCCVFVFLVEKIVRFC